MGQQLNPYDILNDLKETDVDVQEKPEKQASAKRPSKTKPKPDIEEIKRRAEEAATGKMSSYVSELKAKLRDKVQFSFGYVPRFISDIYEDQAKAAGMNKREYLYHLLRERGGDIPPYSDLDGRRLD